MKNISNLLLPALILSILPSCHRTERVEEVINETLRSTVLKPVKYCNTVPVDHYVLNHKWNDPEVWFCQKPSEEKIREWKALCENLNYGLVSKETLDNFANTRHYMLFQDFLETLTDFITVPPDMEDDFIAWRLSEALDGAFSKSDISDKRKQLAIISIACDALMDHECNTPFNRRRMMVLLPKLEEFLTRMLYQAAVSEVSGKQQKLLFEEEDEAWKKYLMASSQSVGEHVSRWKSLNGFVFPDTFCRVERHFTISPEMIDDGYFWFKANTYEYEFGQEVPLSELRRRSREEKSAWMEWMDARARVSASLTGKQKKLYDNCTNNVMRAKLILLLDRFGDSSRNDNHDYSLEKINYPDRELKKRINEIKQEDRICVNFRFDEVIDGFRVTGKFFPYDRNCETGEIEIYFQDVETGITYTYESGHIALSSLNDVVFSERFRGWIDGMNYVLPYNNSRKHRSRDPHQPLNDNLPFQFYDVDFDGSKELLIPQGDRLQGGSTYEVFKLGNGNLVRCKESPLADLQSDSWIDPERKEIKLIFHDGAAFWTEFSFQKGTPVKLIHPLADFEDSGNLPGDRLIYKCSEEDGISGFSLDTLRYSYGNGKVHTYVRRKGKYVHL